jgi:hypothetical protein
MSVLKKAKAATPGPRPQPSSNNPIIVLETEFYAVAKQHFPDELEDADAKKIMWAMYLAGVRSTSFQLVSNAIRPLGQAAEVEFNKLVDVPGGAAAGQITDTPGTPGNPGGTIAVR